jgi:hypothetical protein
MADNVPCEYEENLEKERHRLNFCLDRLAYLHSLSHGLYDKMEPMDPEKKVFQDVAEEMVEVANCDTLVSVSTGLLADVLEAAIAKVEKHHLKCYRALEKAGV